MPGPSRLGAGGWGPHPPARGSWIGALPACEGSGERPRAKQNDEVLYAGAVRAVQSKAKETKLLLKSALDLHLAGDLARLTPSQRKTLSESLPIGVLEVSRGPLLLLGINHCRLAALSQGFRHSQVLSRDKDQVNGIKFRRSLSLLGGLLSVRTGYC